jgi:hypothetical protein
MIKQYILALFFSAANISLGFSDIIYIDPIPNAKFVSVQNSIIIGFSEKLSPRQPGAILNVIGSISGKIEGTYIFTEDNKKILFIPGTNFIHDEVIHVKLNPGIKYKNGSAISSLSFSFTVQSPKPLERNNSPVKTYNGNYLPPFNSHFDNSGDDLPLVNVSISNNPAPGKLFFSNFPFGPIPNNPHLMISDNTGETYFAMNVHAPALDFKKQPNGNLTFFNSVFQKFYEMTPENFIVDSFYCGNGYSTDVHELILLENRNALLMSYDTQRVDMSQIVQGGHPNALVVGLIIQEIDDDNNVVFQWRSWDHIPITDGLHENLLAEHIDYIHGNAIERDFDGHLMISSRHLDEITKINRNTGEMIWRLGGLQNQFTFINDPYNGFHYQHDIRRLANGNITLFDNGNFHTPPFSRAVEYALDEVSKTATLVWEYRNSPDIYGFAMGNVQRLDNGNTLICWGSANPNITEVTPDGAVALEMSLQQGVYTYRAFKFDWHGPQGIYQGPYIIPLAYRLKQNYPNPFNPQTRIEFELPNASFVNLSVYDVLGRLVSTIVNQELPARNYSYTLSSSDFSTGVYFYRLSANDFVETRKMVVVK